MKKILALVMILCALVVGMTGCSNNSEPEATEAPTEAATEAPTEAPADTAADDTTAAE